MNESNGKRVAPMRNPPHLGALVRENMEAVGWSVAETAARLNCGQGTLSRLLNGKTGISAGMAPCPWRAWAGARLSIGCACRQATNWHRCGGSGRPQSDPRKDKTTSSATA